MSDDHIDEPSQGQELIDRGRVLEAKKLAADRAFDLAPGRMSDDYDCVELKVYYTTLSGEHRSVGREIRLLCRGHHRDGPDAQHRSNERAWWKAHGIDPHQLADELYARFKAQ